MRYYRKSWIPPFQRVLIVESGSRLLVEQVLPGIYSHHGPDTRVDIVTCYAGPPKGLHPGSGKVFWIGDYGPGERHRLLSELLERRYTIVGILCSAEPVMTKWKWWLAWRIPAKLFVLNENGDYFFVDLPNWRIVLHFALFRAGLTGQEAVHTLGRLLLLPFTLAYLAAFAAWIHLKRKVRLTFQRASVRDA